MDDNRRAKVRDPNNPFLRLLAERPWLIADGAMGTNLFRRGLISGDAPELWNIDHAARVRDVHREFADAGCDILLTNSFGGNRFRLQLHGLQDRARELAAASASLARAVADDASHPIVVAGSIGPTGELFQPLGSVTREEALAAFREQADGLVAGGADVLWIETMSAVEETMAAVEAATQTGHPVVTTMTFDTAGKTMMGVAPADACRLLAGLPQPPVAVGANCGLGAGENLMSLLAMREVSEPDLPLVAKANCGVPEFRDGAFQYTGTPELMADYARLARDAGARIIGGCCGSDGTIMRAIRTALTEHQAGDPPTEAQITALLGPPVDAGSRNAHVEAGGAGDPRSTGRRRRRSGRDTSRR